jgi:hypothetical protein
MAWETDRLTDNPRPLGGRSPLGELFGEEFPAPVRLQPKCVYSKAVLVTSLRAYPQRLGDKKCPQGIPQPQLPGSCSNVKRLHDNSGPDNIHKNLGVNTGLLGCNVYIVESPTLWLPSSGLEKKATANHFLLVSWLGYISTLKTEVICPSEMQGIISQNTVSSVLHSHYRGNLKASSSFLCVTMTAVIVTRRQHKGKTAVILTHRDNCSHSSTQATYRDNCSHSSTKATHRDNCSHSNTWATHRDNCSHRNIQATHRDNCSHRNIQATHRDNCSHSNTQATHRDNCPSPRHTPTHTVNNKE